MRKIRHIIKKEFLQIRRDRPMMALLFLVPIIQLLILGYAVSADVKNVSVAVCDLDNSSVSRGLIDRFRNSKYFRLRYFERSEGRIGRYLDDGRASMAFVIPRRLSENLVRSMPAQIQILVDGQDSNTSTVALGYVQGILEDDLKSRLSEAGAGLSNGQGLHLIEPDVRIWYNEDLKASHFMIPGIVVFLLTMVTSLISAMGLVREKEIGTLEQLVVSPLKKHEILIGKMVPYSIVGYIELVLAVGFARLWYGIPILGNLGLFALFILVYLFTTLGIGLLVSASAQTQQQAMFMTFFLLIFFMIMSGFIFPIENMPRIMRILSCLDPMRYLIVVTREIFIKGASLRSLYSQGLALTAFSAVIFTFSVWRFQRRMK
jgi:ABC-2 type transport system permease protein